MVMLSPVNRYLHQQYHNKVLAFNDLENTCLIYQVFLDDLSAMTGALNRDKQVIAREKLTHALKVLSVLKTHTLIELSGSAGKQLNEFYDYCTLTLSAWLLDKNPEHIREVETLFRTVKVAWDDVNSSQSSHRQKG